MAKRAKPAATEAEGFLAALADPARPPVPAEGVAVVVAHPDDETIGIGAQLPRLPGATIVLLTDGAPTSGTDAARLGFPSVAAYAATRRQEMQAALALAGIPLDALVAFDIPDQDASLDLAGLSRRLAELFRERGIGVVLTHAYEGGHPDHDAAAFAVRAATRLGATRLGVAREPAAAVIEMPFYTAGPEGWTSQVFLPAEDAPETVIALNEAERDLKGRMMAAHVSQAEILGRMSLEAERFRPAPFHDFTKSPMNGPLLYESFGWGITGERWRNMAGAALASLKLDGPR
jgi:LmbE family N-acetylglucosaminyl deacetylase